VNLIFVVPQQEENINSTFVGVGVWVGVSVLVGVLLGVVVLLGVWVGVGGIGGLITVSPLLFKTV